MENNNNTFKKVNDEQKKYSIPKGKIGFFRGFLAPFVAGMLGATLLVGGAISIPPVRDFLSEKMAIQISDNKKEETSAKEKDDSAQKVEPSTNTQISISDFSNTSINVASKVLPSVVGIQVTYSVNSPYYSFYGMDSQSATASGSGVIITDDGYILTNNHVVSTASSSSYYQVSEATKITVTLYNDSTEYEAKIVGTDEITDLAVLKIEKDGLTEAEIGDSDKVQVGEFAMAIGNPLNMQSSVTTGIISAKDRTISSDGKTYKVIQTDAAINAGNSGGALINAEGKVIGINTLKLSGSGVEGIGFAIPINDTKNVYEQLISNGKVTRPFIGITGRTLDEQTAKQYGFEKLGVYVVSVNEFSPAELAGLKTGDIIFEFDGKEIKTMDELNTYKNEHNIGDEISVKIVRGKEEKELKITLGENKETN